jgi:hypothetical protein
VELVFTLGLFLRPLATVSDTNTICRVVPARDTVRIHNAESNNAGHDLAHPQPQPAERIPFSRQWVALNSLPPA